MNNYDGYSKKKTLFICLIIFSITYLIYFLTRETDSTFYNNFIRLADAFLNGRLYLIEDAPWIELVHIDNKHYVVPPPLPAILSLPFVAIWGLSTNQTLISILFGSINVSLAYLVARKLTQSTKVQIWSTVMFGFGTIHWWVASSGGVWVFSQTVSVTFLFIGILFTFYDKPSFLIGLSLGASYWSRLTTVLSLPFFLIYTYDRWYEPSKIKNIITRINLRFIFLLGLGLAIFIILNGLYNYARFETPFDVSYYLIPDVIDDYNFKYGIFDPRYIPRHLNIIFLKLPEYIDQFPYLIPSYNGLAIWITTPAFIYAFWAGIRNKLTLACWISISLIALVNFSHGTWGFTQFGYRFAVDFYPFLFLLTVKGIGDEIKWHHIVLITAGILVNLWGVLTIQKFQWNGIFELLN